MNDVRYFRIHIFAAIAAMAVLYFVQGTVGMLALVGLIGFACSSIFSVIYSTALKCSRAIRTRPTRFRG